MPSARSRLLILVVAYEAESTLDAVLDRIPAAVLELCDCEVLVVDDASTDRTHEKALSYRERQQRLPIIVLRNAHNQGYGGNQKVGYRYALSHGFDWVALIHGDGQYAPEQLPSLLVPLLDGEADAVFGSRMLQAGDARRGGMPLYKFVGNRILSSIQNRLLGTRFSEFHSGYRIYSTAALAKLPLELNTNDFHFDTEIILQLLQGGFRIRELPINTYYGDEICRVNGLRYAWNVVYVTLQCAIHRRGILYQRRFDLEPPGKPIYPLKLGYASSHSYALDLVPDGSKVADIGAGLGLISQELAAKGCEVMAIDRWPTKTLDPRVRFVAQDLDQPLKFELGDTEYILLLDILEHLESPERFLDELREQFTYRPMVAIISLPNVAFIATRLMLAVGQFNYGSRGILDHDHVRLFTFRSALRLLRDAGFKVRSVRGVPPPYPLAFGTNWLSRVLLRLNVWAIALWRGLFSYQIFIEAETRPSARFVLEDAVQAAAATPPEHRGRQVAS